LRGPALRLQADLEVVDFEEGHGVKHGLPDAEGAKATQKAQK